MPDQSINLFTESTSMARTLRVGVIGASAERGWAKISHVPAIQQLDGLELAAVVTQDQPSADKAARAFGAARGYGDAKDLFADPDIDIVTVAVNVPAHHELVLGALAAGKHLYCEYPLGRDRAEGEMLSEAARKAGLHTAIGLQLRANPAARKAREMVAAGAIGRVLNARIRSTTMAFGPETERAMAFSEKPENGVTLATVQGAHTLDLAIAVLGGFADLSALATTQFPEVKVEGKDGATTQARKTPDYLAVLARTADGAPVAIEVVGGRPPDATPFRFEITGEKGVLVLDGGAARGVQSGTLRLLLDGKEQPLAPPPVAEPDTAGNIAGLYAALRDDILNGTRTVPDFEHAVRMTRLVEDALAASDSGARKAASGWPLQ